ncbi:MAG: penicillin acylase family protein [Bryobacter sp.]|nr:penicillin acylase family protein [Bryobacter sp.]
MVFLFLAAAAALTFYVRQSFPATSGELVLDVSQGAQMERDALGIPHVKAATVEDAVYLQGFLHAQDRFWQMEATRRLAAGEMAEIVGAVALESDLASRRILMRATAVRLANTLTTEDRRWFAAYARGVNDWLLANRENLPLEIRLLGYTPRPWIITDSLLVGLHMFRTLSTTWTLEADRARLAGQGDAAKIEQLFPLRTGTEIAYGSNAWAIGPQRAKNGKAILAGDPHMEQTWPSTFYVNHLQGAELDVIGASLPGAPGVIIGHNQRIAWSVTNLHFDVQDLYFNETRLVGQQKETIRVKGRPDVEIVIALTPNGPLVERHGQTMALRWTPYFGEYSFPFLDLNKAQNWEQFREALKRFPGPCQNFIYADVEGNIGYQAAGRMPLRRTQASHLPLDARLPENDWQGFIPFNDLPSALNPESGYLITANQNPFPAQYPHPVAGHFTPPYRQRQIAARLRAQNQWDAAGMTSVQTDVYSAFHHFLARQLAQAAKGRDAAKPELAQARKALEQWDGQMAIGQAAPLITELAYQELAKAFFRRAAGNAPQTQGMFTPAVIERLLRERPREKPNDWFTDYDQVLLEALVAALENGAAKYGRNPQFWDYGRYMQIFIQNAVLGNAVSVGRMLAKPGVPFRDWIAALRLPFLDNYVMVGPLPLSGGTLTIKQVNPRLGSAIRFIADTADWENSTLTLTLGQSGHAFHGHSRDHWEAYYNAGAVPLPYKKYKADASLSVRPKFKKP